MAVRNPYQTVKVEGKTYDDYSVTLKKVIYDISVCRETRVLNIRRDEDQGIKLEAQRRALRRKK